jgi:hypothetical protein
MAVRLKNLGIAFIDVAGNAYINAPPVYVFVKGNRPPEELVKPKQNRAFQPTGLRVIFAFLCYPHLVNAPYREIADKTGAALGTLNLVLKDLKDLGFLVTLPKDRRRLVRKEELFKRWVEAYPEQLKPKLIIGRFEALKNDWWKTIRLTKGQAYWGGEVAAAKMTRFLKPQLVTVYVRGNPAETVIKGKLRKHPNGNTNLLKAFWNKDLDWQENQLVQPILTYADLMATGDPRNVETANKIYEDEIAGLIEQG